jgi:methionyl-tRNA formyltransferase
MRIVFLSVDDEFAGSMQRFVYEMHPEWIVASVISTCSIYKKSPLGAMLFVLRRSGLRYGAEMFRMKVVRRLARRQQMQTPSQLAHRHGVQTFSSGNINDAESVRRLTAWSPDLVISTNFSHYIGRHVRSIARLGTWNVHKSYLPHYRGMAPSFYALLNAEMRVGATIHLVADGFDTGDIVGQVRVAVVHGDSVYSLNRRTSEAGGRLLAHLLEGVESAAGTATPQPQGSWPSYSYPTRAHVREFLNKGLRF